MPTHLISESATESPFDYKNNSCLYIPSVLPKLKESPNYIKEISDICLELIQVTNGHTIILFTSYKTLISVYAELKEQLKDYEIIKMVRGNKTAISSFKQADNAVLFAAGSMWEGIDIAGDKLSSVIIVRLPFPQRSILMEEKKKTASALTSLLNNLWNEIYYESTQQGRSKGSSVLSESQVQKETPIRISVKNICGMLLQLKGFCRMSSIWEHWCVINTLQVKSTIQELPYLRKNDLCMRTMFLRLFPKKSGSKFNI